MTTADFLSLLRSKDIRLWVESGRLHYDAPRGVVTAELSTELARRKAELISVLDHSTEAAPVILPVTRDRPLPLSFVQERLWILDQLEPGNTTYNLGSALAIDGPLDVKALEESLGEIIRRHETLRTSFTADDGIPQQVIAPAASFQLPCIMLNDVPEEKREQKIQELINREARRPFDLARGPLFRACLLCVDKESHVLLLNMHHIVSDGWSMGVLFKELSVIYAALVTKTEVSLPTLPVQYADFAIWQRQWLTGKTLAKQLAYWKQQLQGAPAGLELPHDRPRPALQTFVGGRLSLSLSDSLGKALRNLSSREGATLFMFLLTAFEVLLYRYTGQEDVVVGSPIAGRNRTETEGLIGFFINSLVLRTDLSGNPTFRQLLARVRSVALDAYAHQDVPFEKLVEELRPERDLSRTPFFQVFFNMLNLDGAELRLPGLRLRRLSGSEAQSKFDLTIYARAEGNNIHFNAVYNADLFRPDRISEMLAQLESILAEAVRDPDRRIAGFSLVTDRTEKCLPSPTQPLDSSWKGAVHTQFSLQAQTSPQREAVIDSSGAWSYKDLDSCSNQLANYLRHSGIEPHDIIAIYGHRSAPLVLAVLGILKAGAAFVILDPAYPATRLIDCLQAAKPRGWLHIEAAGPVPDVLEEFITSAPFRCRLQLPRDSAAISRDSLCGYSTDDPGVVVGPDDLAYVAFTSGSTGRPKGILGRHGSLSHFLPWQQETFDLGATDRFSMLSGLSHDPLQRDLFTPLWLGATICIPDPEIIGTAQLTDWMAKEEVTFAHLTPPMAELLVETAGPECRIPSLRYAFFVGDKLTQRDVVRLRKLAPGVTCINSYGSTETQRAVGYYVVPQSSDSEQSREKSVYPLGRGIKDVQLLVLTAEQRLAGVGELGEIHVRSPHLALGYLGDEALTRMRFSTNPFTGVTTDRLYKTGDLGRYLPDGNVEFAGRGDRQVKIRGFRVEPEEVEAVLGQEPSIQQALVLVREDVPDQKRLVAYLIARAGPALTPTELRNFAKSKLPDYMVPSAFVYLDELPLTPNGKVDTEALPAPDRGSADLEDAFVAPRTKVEEVLAKIWAGVLKLEQVGVYDNFFDLGGHSLLAARVISRVREGFQVEIALRALFENPTIAGLATQIEHLQRQSAAPKEIADLLADLESLSDEEAQYLLAEESPKV
jgi:amino acid adenylation domain-containing protein